jgi:hydrogenase maturation protein HypF
MRKAFSIRVRGVVQGVGFRPFVYRLAAQHSLAGWILNGDHGVEIFIEGEDTQLAAFLEKLQSQSPPAAQVSDILSESAQPLGLHTFTIRGSQTSKQPTVRISPDLPVCFDCLSEMCNPNDRRYLYPYINCTNCGPRYSVILALPYDRPNTTVKDWRLDDYCEREYRDPSNRRFHAQPVACPVCGPAYFFQEGERITGPRAFEVAAQRLTQGAILAVKGLGGYHLACDARRTDSVRALRDRKFRKEKPFAIMVDSFETARTLAVMTAQDEELLSSLARPIVLVKTKHKLGEVAPENDELGIMLPYAPVHHLLFRAGAPSPLVMTSANRSSEPIAYEDEEAFEALSGMADAFLVGERPIARRVEDSVARASPTGPMILRRSRGYAPAAVTKLPTSTPILAVGADLKSSVTLVVNGQAFVSQHIGDLEHYQALRAFQETISDLLSMYEVDSKQLVLVHDSHPQYVSASHARTLVARQVKAVQHHRAHVASVLAEREAWDEKVVGISFDGTGYGDDGSIWGGEIFCGSLRTGLSRVAHLRQAVLPGGDAAAHSPVQAAAGFLSQLEGVPDLSAAPFLFPRRYEHALQLVCKNVRAFATTSVGRLFDTVAALLGFTRDVTFEGQAAIWVEQLARRAQLGEAYPFPFVGRELDFRPLLQSVLEDRKRGRAPSHIAAAFHMGLVGGVVEGAAAVCEQEDVQTIVLSGGVFQNWLLVSELTRQLQNRSFNVWTNHAVPPNDGGISLGQAALAAFGAFADPHSPFSTTDNPKGKDSI